MAKIPMASNIIWRIAKHTDLVNADDLSGEGARLTGGRWNRKSVAVTYCASSIALAALEMLVRVDSDIASRNRFLIAVTIPESIWQKREIISADELEPTWLAEPPGTSSIEFGSDWLNGASAALLMVPSIIVPEEYNVLLNPGHADTQKLKAQIVRQFICDPRL